MNVKPNQKHPNNNSGLKNETITDAKCVETYCALSQQLYTQYHDRRTLEWKMHLALWTLLALTAYLCVTKDKHLGQFALGIFLTVPVHFVWTIKIHKGQLRDHSLSAYYRSQAEKILTSRHPTDIMTESISKLPVCHHYMETVDSIGFLHYWWWLAVTVGTTFLLCMGVWFLVR